MQTTAQKSEASRKRKIRWRIAIYLICHTIPIVSLITLYNSQNARTIEVHGTLDNGETFHTLTSNKQKNCLTKGQEVYIGTQDLHSVHIASSNIPVNGRCERLLHLKDNERSH